MSARHLLTPTGATRCGADAEPGRVTSDPDLVSCRDGCLSIFPPPYGDILPAEQAQIIAENAPEGAVLVFPLGDPFLMSVLDYRPVQGPPSRHSVLVSEAAREHAEAVA